MPRSAPSRRRLAAFAAAALLVVLLCLRRARDRAAAVPLSPLTAGRRVGADYADALPTGGPLAGEMDDLAAYARPGFDPADVDPAVRRFYERTADYDLAYDVAWWPGFRTGAALAARLTSRIEQLNLPGPGERGHRQTADAPFLASADAPFSASADARRMASEFRAVESAADPREGARLWTRIDPATGEAVFVAVYAAHERDGVRYVNIAAPLPWSNLSTVLRVDPLDAGDGRTGVELTTFEGDGDAGLYLVTPVGAFPLPLDQRFRVSPADAPGATDVPDGEDDARGDSETVVATHEMWLYGRQFLTIRYVAWPRDARQ